MVSTTITTTSVAAATLSTTSFLKSPSFLIMNIVGDGGHDVVDRLPSTLTLAGKPAPPLRRRASVMFAPIFLENSQHDKRKMLAASSSFQISSDGPHDQQSPAKMASGGVIKPCLKRSLNNIGRRFEGVGPSGVKKRVTFQVATAGNSTVDPPDVLGPTRFVANSPSTRDRNVGSCRSPESGKSATKQRGIFIFSSVVSACRECHALEPGDHVKNKMVPT